ncbi:hypothetical protein ACXWTF_12545 [Thiomicrolovo sp. ZZH C-3]
MIGIAGAGAKDLGTFGATYPVGEPDIIAMLKKEHEANEPEYSQMVQEGIDAAFSVDVTLKPSHADATTEGVDTFVLPYDIYDEFGSIRWHQGDVAVAPAMPKGITESFCFVDGARKDVLPAAIREMGSECKFLVANEDVRVLMRRPEYEGMSFYPYSSPLAERYAIESFPAKLTLFEDKKRVTYYSVDRLREIMKNRR